MLNILDNTMTKLYNKLNIRKGLKKMKLGEIICNYRNEHKLSQRQFAKKCGGLSNGYVSMLENDLNPTTNKSIAPSLDKLKCIAQGMDMSLNDLLEIADDMPVELYPNGVSISNSESVSKSRNVSIKEGLSSKAIALAKLYDSLDEYGQHVVDTIAQLESNRPSRSTTANQSQHHLIPHIGTLNCTGEIETRHAAMQEVAEIPEDNTWSIPQKP